MVARTRHPRTDENPAAGARPARGAKQPRDRSTSTSHGFLRAWRGIARRLPLLRNDLTCYATAQGDRARLAVRNVAARALSAVMLSVAVALLFVLAAARVLAGAAGGLASVLGGNLWLGDLIAGTAALALLTAAIAIGVKVDEKRRLRELEQRYRRFRATETSGDDK